LATAITGLSFFIGRSSSGAAGVTGSGCTHAGHTGALPATGGANRDQRVANNTMHFLSL
jgi:hypothetical protein